MGTTCKLIGASHPTAYPVLDAEAAAAFRTAVRQQLVSFIRTTFPSLKDTDKPEPPADWSKGLRRPKGLMVLNPGAPAPRPGPPAPGQTRRCRATASGSRRGLSKLNRLPLRGKP